jgi:hypothetical protein
MQWIARFVMGWLLEAGLRWLGRTIRNVLHL